MCRRRDFLHVEQVPITRAKYSSQVEKKKWTRRSVRSLSEAVYVESFQKSWWININGLNIWLIKSPPRRAARGRPWNRRLPHPPSPGRLGRPLPSSSGFCIISSNNTHACLVTLLPWSLWQPSDPAVKFQSVMGIENPQNAKQEGDAPCFRFSRSLPPFQGEPKVCTATNKFKEVKLVHMRL